MACQVEACLAPGGTAPRTRTEGSAQVADQVRERCVLRERRMTLEQRRETSAGIGSDRGYRSFELRAKGSQRPVEPGLGVRVFRMQRIGRAILRHGVVEERERFRAVERSRARLKGVVAELHCRAELCLVFGWKRCKRHVGQ